MTSEENAVRTLLQEADMPATRLDAGALLAGGKRSRRRRRIGRTAGAVLAVVAVMVPVAVVASRTSGPDAPVLKDPDPTVSTSPVSKAPDVPAGGFATTLRIEHVTTSVEGELSCTVEPLPSDDGDFNADYAVDLSGKYLVGSAGTGTVLNLWTDGTRQRFTIPDRRGFLTAAAVNSSGAVLGYDPGSTDIIGDRFLNFIWRAGTLTYLKKPSTSGTPVARFINERGDVLGSVVQLVGTTNLKALVIWPAGRPTEPRILAETTLRPLALRDDGTVIAARTTEGTGDRGDALVVYKPDGTRLQIDVPAELGGAFYSGTVRGDLFYTSTGSGPVRWNLRTGLVEVFDEVTTTPVGNPGGWFEWGPGRFDPTQMLVAPDRKAFTVTFGGIVTWVSADGSTFIGTKDGHIFVARCSR